MVREKIKIALLVLIVSTISSFLYSYYPLTEEGKSPFVEVVKNLSESVVNIEVEATIESPFRSDRFPFNDDFFRFFFGPMPESRRSVSMGSGFIFNRVNNDVYILTNNHVVERGESGSITVTLADKAKYEAEIVGLDPMTDLAIIKIEVEKDIDVVSAPLGDSDKLEIGEWAIAIGNPFGRIGLDRTVTVGVISATGRASLDFGSNSPVFQDYIQTDAAINPGNSGGPLLNLNGEVIGVNSAITSTSGGNIGIGFAIPINLAKRVISDFLEKGRVVRAYLGILPQEITYDLQRSLGLERVGGVLVARVESDTPAYNAGLKNGDVIIEFNNREVQDVPRFRLIVAESEIGKRIPVRILRKNKEMTLHAVLTELPDSPVASVQTPESKRWLGLQVNDLDRRVIEERQLPLTNGIIISNIEPGSAADNSELNRGDIIIEINHTPIRDVEEFQSKAAEIQQSYKDTDSYVVLFYIVNRNGAFRYVTVNAR